MRSLSFILVLLFICLSFGETRFPCQLDEVVLMGDSIVRNIFVQLINEAEVESLPKDRESYKGHKDFKYILSPKSVDTTSQYTLITNRN